VCGGRAFTNERLLRDTLNRMMPEVDHVIVGGAKGADELAEKWARGRAIPVTVYTADWLFHGKAAGPLRNIRMLTDGRPDKVVAFPGGRGTAHMVKIAKDAGIAVVEIAHDP